MEPHRTADLARVREAAPAVAANQYGHTYLGMGNEVPALHEALAPYETAEHIDGYRDREPQLTDGPDYHADHAAWVQRNDGPVRPSDDDQGRTLQSGELSQPIEGPGPLNDGPGSGDA